MGNYIKIAYFPSTSSREQVLGSNGKNITNYCTRCETTEENNNYVVDMTFTLEASEYLDEENILKVRMDYGYEVFRISKVTKGLRYIDIVARQITIADTLTMWLDDVRPTDTTGQSALEHINSGATSRRKEIIFKSDINKVSTAYYQDMNVYSAISDCDQSFLNRWGGEILRRDYTLSINKRVGRESGVTIREGKNIDGFSGESSIDNLVTRAIGQGYNGIKGHYIDSPLINNYSNIYNKKIEYSDVRLRSDKTTDEEEGCIYFDTLEEVQKELDNRVTKEFSENDIDKVKATYSINFATLERTNYYKDYSHAEKVMLGDTVRVYVSKLGTDIKVRVIAKKYDVLAERTKEITLSNEVIIKNISMANVISELQKIESGTDNPVATYIDAMQRAGIQNSYIVTRENEFLALDTKDINTAKNVVKINNKGLFFSNNGYYGEYKNGFTIDGIINADRIRAGILTAIQIQNVSGTMIMDLRSDNGLMFRSKDSMGNFRNDIHINKGRIDMYNRTTNNNNIIGTITSLRKVDDPNVTNLGIIHDKDSAINIGYTYDDMDVKPSFENYSYITLDKFDKFNSNKGCPVKIKKDTALAAGCKLCFFVDNEKPNSGVQFMSSDDYLCIGGKGGVSLGILKDNGNLASKISIKSDRIDLYTDLYINGVKVYPGTGGGASGGGTVLSGSWWDIAFNMVGQEESGHSDPGCISNISWDAGGKSYGAYQFSLNMGSLAEFVNWLGTEGSTKATNWYNRLNSHALGSDAFDAEWKAIANEDHDGFLHIQQKRMIVAFYKPALNEIAKINSSFVAGNYTVGLNACILSTAIQFGPGGYNSNGSVWSYVFSNLADEPTMLQRFKDSRTAYFSATSERYAREYTATMNMYNTYSPKTFGDGYGSPDGGSALQLAVVNSARKLIGKPYVYGGNYAPLGSDSGTDCSGLE